MKKERQETNWKMKAREQMRSAEKDKASKGGLIKKEERKGKSRTTEKNK